MKTAIKRDAPAASRPGQPAPAHAHRTTIAAPQALLDEALDFGRRDGLTSLNAVVQVALAEYAERRRRAAFAAAVAEMARDPDVIRESRQIDDVFAATDADGNA